MTAVKQRDAADEASRIAVQNDNMDPVVGVVRKSDQPFYASVPFRDVQQGRRRSAALQDGPRLCERSSVIFRPPYDLRHAFCADSEFVLRVVGVQKDAVFPDRKRVVDLFVLKRDHTDAVVPVHKTDLPVPGNKPHVSLIIRQYILNIGAFRQVRGKIPLFFHGPDG